MAERITKVHQMGSFSHTSATDWSIMFSNSDIQNVFKALIDDRSCAEIESIWFNLYTNVTCDNGYGTVYTTVAFVNSASDGNNSSKRKYVGEIPSYRTDKNPTQSGSFELTDYFNASHPFAANGNTGGYNNLCIYFDTSSIWTKNWKITSMDLTVKYKDEHTIKVEISPPNTGTVTGAGTYTHTHSAQLGVTPNNGYHINYWNKNSSKITDSDGKNSISVKVEGNDTYTAVLQGNQYTVEYNGNGATGGSTSPSTHIYGTASNLRVNGFSRSYTVSYDASGGSCNTNSNVATYSFANWNTSADGKGTTYGKQASISTLATSGSKTLYAQWNSASVTLPTPTRTGYTFTGWYTSDNKSIGMGGVSYTPTANITLYARWKINSYTLQIDPNGGYRVSDNSTAIISITKDYNTTETISERRRTGYTLTGYTVKRTSDNSTSNIGGATFSFNSSTKEGTFKQGTTDITLTAQWIANSYTVTFNPDGGSVSETSRNITYDTKYGSSKSLPTPVRDCFTFAGWYTEKQITFEGTNGTRIIDSTVLKTAREHSLYAQWIPHKIIFTYYGNNENNTPFQHWEALASQGWPDNHWNYTKEDEDYYQTKTGYLSKQHPSSGSKGTYEIRDKNGRVIGEVGEDQKFYSYQELCNVHGVNISTQSIELDLYALWVPITYTIIFDANTGTGSMNNLPMVYDQSKNLPKCIFEKTGYTFQGWSINKNATSATYSDTQLIPNLTAEDGASVTLYAVWKANEYTIIYYGNGHTHGSTTSSDHTYGVYKNLTENGFRRIYEVKYDPTENGTCPINSNSAEYDFTEWRTNSDGSGDRYTNGQSVKNLTATKNGIVNLYAQWKTNSVILPKPQKKGYTFDGWYTSDNKYVGMDGDSYTPETSLTLIAHWIEHQYIIEFDGNGATSGSMEPTEPIDYDQNKKLPKNSFLKTGYTFVAWNTLADGSGESYIDEKTIKNLSDINGDVVKLYAQWEPNKYIIEFEPNGGSSISGEKNSQVHIYDSELKLLKNEYFREGYTFIGWAIHSDAEKPDFEDEEIIINLVTGNITKLYAIWRAHTYTISFNGNNFTSGEMSEILNVTYDQSIKLPKNRFTKIGYSFLGWAQIPFANQEQIEIPDEGNALNLTTEDNGHIILYAVWNQQIYNITWKRVDDGKDVVQPAYGGTIPEYKGTPYINPDENLHYLFQGWNRTILIADGDTEYTAVYKVNNHSYTIKETHEPKGDALNCEAGYTRYICDERTCGHYYDISPYWRIVFKDENENVLSDRKIPINTKFYPPAYKKPADTIKEKFIFEGWKEIQTEEMWKEGIIATANFTYEASCKSIPQQYPVNWCDGDGKIIYTQMIEYGEQIPEYNLEEWPWPTKTSDDAYNYIFDETWDYKGEINEGTVVGPVYCYAQFSKQNLIYKVTWKNSDNTVLYEEDGFKYQDKSPVYPKEIPKYPLSVEPGYRYEFIGWRSEIQNNFYPEGEDLPLVTSSITYIAVYNKITELYKVKVQIYRVDYPIQIVYEDLVYDEILNIDAHYYGAPKGHTFIKWSDNSSDSSNIKRTIKVTGNAEYIAEYSTNKYSIQWLDYNNQIIATKEEIPYRTIPNHKEIEASYNFIKPQNERYHYIFKGNWNIVRGAATSDGEILSNVVYRAIYDEVKHNWDETKVDFYLTIGEASATRCCQTCGRIEQTRVKLIKRTLEGEKPTCTSPGKISYIASFNSSWNIPENPIVIKEDIPALGHLWSAAQKIGGDGEYGYHCRVCHACNTAEISKHTWSEGRPNILGACIYGGVIKRTCTAPGCTAVWNQAVIPGEHGTFVETTEKKATCTKDGHKGYKQCTVCKLYFDAEVDANKTYGSYTLSPFILPAIGHNYIEDKITKASCFSNGSIEMKCTHECGINKFVEIPKRKHNYKIIEPIHKTELPCKEPYSVLYICLNEEEKYYESCKNEKIEEGILDPHTPITIKGIPPTCTTKGESDEIRCKVCGDILEKKYELPPLGHHMISKSLVPAENTLRREIMNVCSRKDCDYKIHLYYSD